MFGGWKRAAPSDFACVMATVWISSSMSDAHTPPFTPLNPEAEITVTSNRLPHWEQAGAAYFVTFRLHDSLPQSLLDTWDAERHAWMALHPQPWSTEVEREFHQQFAGRVEEALDLGHGSCALRKSEAMDLVEEALTYFDGSRCQQYAWVVMPNHVHVLFTVLEPWRLAQVLHSWKSFSSNGINRVLGRSGKFWQKDYYDRLIRDGAHFARCVRYIRNNGPKAGLATADYRHWECAYAQEIA
jgi:putative transposase